MRSWIAVVLATGCRFGFSDVSSGAIDGGGDVDAAEGSRDLQITVTGRGVAAGPFGVCASQCTYAVAGDLTVNAYSADSWSLVPNSACAGSTCNVPADVARLDLTFTQAPITANIVFVSSTATSMTSGAAALDTHCQNLATAANLPGMFIAFASTTTVNARDRIAGSRGWVRVDGMPILDQPSDIGSTSLSRAITMDETGNVFTVLPNLVATGSDSYGTVHTGNNCGDWSTTSMQMSGGRGLAVSSWMLGGWVSGCLATNQIYCMQTGRNIAMQVTPPAFPVGRRLFATRGLLAVGSAGIVAGDQLCQSEAAGAGLTGSYRALLATTTQSAATHLGTLAGPWRRTDDVLVTLGELGATELDAAITVDATGAYFGTQIAFGAGDLHSLAAASSSCDDWTNGTPMILQGSTMAANPFNSAPFMGSCASIRILCAELP